MQSKKNVPTAELRARTMEHINTKYKEFLHIYLDGSKIASGEAASAIFCEFHKIGEAFQISPLCNNFTAETFAFYLLLKS
ncbi:hypothetical protein GE061_019982 [Apolygus lucorum]|uniref:Uncharacterized protein n=1 Tax=Apolygus lucorum TaxID=248454 RepID=A0A8S9XC06_APOLU|nr:hypothetical protein GE061_019982 [Apolygus lucorum]